LRAVACVDGTGARPGRLSGELSSAGAVLVQAPWAAWLITAATPAGREKYTAWLPIMGHP
jgi:hypothetical protein